MLQLVGKELIRYWYDTRYYNGVGFLVRCVWVREGCDRAESGAKGFVRCLLVFAFWDLLRVVPPSASIRVIGHPAPNWTSIVALYSTRSRPLPPLYAVLVFLADSVWKLCAIVLS